MSQRQLESTDEFEPLNEVLAYLNQKGVQYGVKDLENVSLLDKCLLSSENDTVIITSDEIILPKRKKKES
ncbi:hypothetical protein [Vibrio fluvialis]|uniref:hypothetical protein n=1 Tax=Vibrio fluvialis TaxID=676 RepID=UPI0013024B97|nr:hypothetical protein [Vibrio fluvialis]MCG6391842.1 hypothetical protein [Vibrio fluvialis]